MIIKKYALSIILLVLLIFFKMSSSLSALEPVKLIPQNMDGSFIGRHLEYLEDKDRQLKIDDVISNKFSSKFKPSKIEIPNFGSGKTSVYWLRFNVLNETGKEINWFLNLDYPFMNKIGLFYKDISGKYIAEEQGLIESSKKRNKKYRTYVFSLADRPGLKTYYMRIECPITLKAPLRVWSKDEYYNNTTLDNLLYGFFFGFMFIMIFYNLFLFLSTKEYSYLFLVFIFIGFELKHIINSGIGFQYLWPGSPWMYEFFLYLIGILAANDIIFMRLFLGTKIHTPKIDKVFLAYLFFCLIYLVVMPLPVVTRFQMVIIMRVLYGLNIIMILLAIISSIIILRKGNRAGKFFLIAVTPTILLYMFYMLILLNVVPGKYHFSKFTHYVETWLPKAADAIFITLLSIGLADKLNILKEELQELNTRILDIKVDKRTRSMTHAIKESIENGIDYIEKNYHSNLSREGLAASLEMNPDDFGRYFKLYTGKRINEFINELRIEEFLKNIEGSDKSITELAFEVGFESLRTFYRIFFKIMKTTPTKYKENLDAKKST